MSTMIFLGKNFEKNTADFILLVGTITSLDLNMDSIAYFAQYLAGIPFNEKLQFATSLNSVSTGPGHN